MSRHDPRSRIRPELTRLIGLLVDHPDDVEIRERRDRGGLTFEVRVDPDDVGQVIGRQGRTARALRALLEVRGDEDGRRYALDIQD